MAENYDVQNALTLDAVRKVVEPEEGFDGPFATFTC